MRTLDEIQKEIDELKAIKPIGSECEVYSRIVGYYRPLKNWNAGQAEQYKERKTFIIKE